MPRPDESKLTLSRTLADRPALARWLGLAVLLLALTGCEDQSNSDSAASDAATNREGIAFVNVGVVSMTSETLQLNQNVLIEDGKILAVGPSDRIAVPAGFTRINASGKILAPGLADMHAHPMTQLDLNAYLANGVTLIRAMWGEQAVLELREGVDSGKLLGPRIITGGRIVDGEPVIHYGSDQVLDADAAQRVVAAHKEAGYDFIKVYSNLSLEAFDAIVEAARANEIPFEGHIPNAVPTEHAFRSGMRTAEHLIGIGSATLREGAENVSRFDPNFVQFATRLGSGELKLEDVYDPAKLSSLAELAASTGIWTVPTLVTIRGTALSPEGIAGQMQRDAMNYLDYTVKEFWTMGSMFRFGWTADTYRGTEMLLAHELSQVKALHDAGARILAGTDAPNAWAFVGFSMVDELELYVDAGLTTFEALATATLAPAEFAGEEGKAGVVANGARADLVLLSENPLEDVAAYRAIQGVMTNGKWVDRASLDALLAQIVSQSESKAAHFKDAPEWLTAEGEQARFSAEFVTEQNGEKVGADRVTTVQTPDGASAVIGQVLDSNGRVRQIRVERDGSMQTKRAMLEAIDSDGVSESQTIELGTAPGLFLTGTAVDWLTLGPSISDMKAGDTREVPVSVFEDGELVAASATVTRHATEVLVGHFYFTGSDPHDIRVTTPSGSTDYRVWMGGGFYTGWPVKVVVRPDEAGEPATEYRRIL